MRLIFPCSCSHVRSGRPTNRLAKLPNEQWVTLFNGQDLTGWVEVGHEKWNVVDGVIHGQGITQDYGYLKTENNYKDFDMSVRFKCEGDGNSGVFFPHRIQARNGGRDPGPAVRDRSDRRPHRAAFTATGASGSSGRRRNSNAWSTTMIGTITC